MNETNNFTNITFSLLCSEDMPYRYRLPRIVISVLTMILGITGNILVLLTVANRKKRTGNDLFIVNIAVSDLIVLITYLPLKSDELIFCKITTFPTYCKILWPLAQLTFFVSIFTMTAMAIHRCRHVKNPFLPPEEKHKIFMYIGIVWLLSFFSVLPLFIATKFDPVLERCNDEFSKSTREAYYVIIFLVQMVIPLMIISVAYFLIWNDLRKSTAFRASIRSNGQLTTNSNGRENRQVTRTIVIIVALFVICMLPYHIVWLFFLFGHQGDETVSAISGLLVVFNCCVNPIVYGSLTRHFRRSYYRFICFPCIKFTKNARFWFASQSSSPHSSSIKESLSQRENSDKENSNGIPIHSFDRRVSIQKPTLVSNDVIDKTMKADENKNVEETETKLAP